MAGEDHVNSMLEKILEAVHESRQAIQDQQNRMFSVLDPKLAHDYRPLVAREKCQQLESNSSQLFSSDSASVLNSVILEGDKPLQIWSNASTDRGLDKALEVLDEDKPQQLWSNAPTGLGSEKQSWGPLVGLDEDNPQQMQSNAFRCSEKTSWGPLTSADMDMETPYQTFARIRSERSGNGSLDSNTFTVPVSYYSNCSNFLKRDSNRSTHVWEQLFSSSCTELLRTFVNGPQFDFMMGVVIVANSIIIGFQINASIDKNRMDEDAPIADYIFLIVYMIEFCTRVWAAGLKLTLESNWNKFDLLLVTVGGISLFVISPLQLGEQGIDILQHLSILRLLRLLRLVRALRLLQQFQILWRLVNGLLHALGTILSTMALLCLLIYIIACFGVEIITKSSSLQLAAESDPNLRDILDLHFRSLPLVMMTLIRFTTMDTISTVYEPLVRQNNWLMLYFGMILLVVSITIMNLITAVLVEHSITMAKTDSELSNHMKKKRVRLMAPKIEELFERLDKNGDGLLTLAEAISADVELPVEFANIVSRDGLFDLFEALDGDQSGFVDKQEFVEGVINLAMSDVPVEFFKVLHYCRIQKEGIRKIGKDIRRLRSAIGIVDNSPHHGTASDFGSCLSEVKQNTQLLRQCLMSEPFRSLSRDAFRGHGDCLKDVSNGSYVRFPETPMQAKLEDINNGSDASYMLDRPHVLIL